MDRPSRSSDHRKSWNWRGHDRKVEFKVRKRQICFVWSKHGIDSRMFIEENKKQEGTQRKGWHMLEKEAEVIPSVPWVGFLASNGSIIAWASFVPHYL